MQKLVKREKRAPKNRNNQHPEFANGHPLNYYSSDMQLELPERTGRLLFWHSMVDCGERCDWLVIYRAAILIYI
jgi:hypothetical protein